MPERIDLTAASGLEGLPCGHSEKSNCLLTQLGGFTVTETCEDPCRVCQRSLLELEEELDALGRRVRMAREQSGDFASIDLSCTLPQYAGDSWILRTSETAEPDSLMQIPASVGPYRVLGLLGRGGMGIVYRVLAPDGSRELAVKTLTNSHNGDSHATARFRREAATIRKLHHPGIVPLVDWGESDGLLYMVMPVIEGSSVASMLTPGQPWKLPDASEVIRQMAEALSYAHSCMVIHRDVKPSNVMLTRASGAAAEVRLLDLGVARTLGPAAESTLTEHGQTLGTLDFIAPEQIGDSHNVDHTADIYSLGATAYLLLTGVPPCGIQSHRNAYDRMLAVRNTSILPISVRNPQIPESLAVFIDRMLEREPSYRPRKMSEIASVFEAFSSQHQLGQRLDDWLRCRS